MGEVWSAIHHRIGTPVAVKFLTAEGLQQPDFLRAFRVEARAVAALDHPGEYARQRTCAALSELADKNMPYNPKAPEQDRLKVIAAWKTWLADTRKSE